MVNRWAIFLSGRGSTAQAILDLIPFVDIGVIVTSNINAKGVSRAKRAGVPVISFNSKTESWLTLIERLRCYKINRIFLAGYLKIIPADFLDTWKNKIWNIHPSLLPDYSGINAFERSLSDGASLGVTIHKVIPELDAGDVLSQNRFSRASALILTKLRLARVEQKMLRNFVQKGLR